METKLRPHVKKKTSKNKLDEEIKKEDTTLWFKDYGDHIPIKDGRVIQQLEHLKSMNKRPRIV